MDMRKIKLSLSAGAIFVILMDMAFLWILNMNETETIQRMLRLYILILGGAAIGAVILFFVLGPVMDVYGNIEMANIMAMLVSVLVIIQLAFAFAVYAQKEQEMSYEMYTDMRRVITRLEFCQDKEQQQYEISKAVRHYEQLVYVDIVDAQGEVSVSLESDRRSDVKMHDQYRFPYFKRYEIVFGVNRRYYVGQILRMGLNLLTTLVVSIFFSVEMVWGLMGLVRRGIKKDCQKPAALDYVRQIAFLFYFASRLSAAFIPTLAKSLVGSLPFVGENMAAGFPQSAETLFTCVAIFATTELLTRKGWKLPFMAGLGLVVGGTVLSAISGNLMLFIAARAVVGLGYGFCWMTLRNLALFGRDDKEKTWGFSMLNAGLYAGMNCGSALGAILAECFGSENVFFMAASLTALCGVVIMRLENAVLPKRDSREKGTDGADLLRMAEKIRIAAFAVLMIAPSCIVGSYISYYLPLYYANIGKNVSDVGRVQMLYGLIIVYAGPFLSAKILEKAKNLARPVIAYNLLFSIGLVVSGGFGGMLSSIVAVICLGLADCFGFGVQNNYFLAFPAVVSMGESRSLSYLSFLKKITEMLGPMAYAAAIMLGFERGLVVMGCAFLASACLYAAMEYFSRRGALGKSLLEMD